MLRFFLWDWIMTYIEKPKIDQTPADEILFYTALAIIFGIAFGIAFGIYCLIMILKPEKKNKR